jgi:ABC-type spermidine/putrescine transport system permease subunit II
VSPVGAAFKAIIVLFMVTPVTCIAVLSFSQENALVFPPPAWGVGLYEQFFHSSYWLGALLTSVKIGVPSAVLATLVGSPAAWALSRARVPFQNAVMLLGVTPLLLPSISFAIALYIIYLKFNLLYTTYGLVLADSVLAIPFILLIVKAAIDRIPVELELVAMSLGATRRRAVWGVTVQLLRPALAAALLFSFMTSFDESTIVQFLGGPGQTTLPKAIFDSVRTGLQPVIMAIATIMVFGSGILMLLVGRLRGGRTAGR